MKHIIVIKNGTLGLKETIAMVTEKRIPPVTQTRRHPNRWQAAPAMGAEKRKWFMVIQIVPKKITIGLLASITF